MYSQDFKAKIRDVKSSIILNSKGQFVTPKDMSKTQYVIPGTSLSFLQKIPPQFLGE